MSNTQTIAKNTIYLYIRSIVSLLIQLYTSRLVLEALGVEDFGVYQVVGGLVTMFSFLNGTMAAATQRFLSYEIGIGNREKIIQVFSMSINIHAALSIIIFILVETIGLIFMKTKIDLGQVSLSTAYWVLHCTALSLVITINSVPYNSFLIAKEHMQYFAYIDIIGAFLKLGVAISLLLFSSNRLIHYAILTLVVTLIIRVAYAWVCHTKFTDAKYKRMWSSKLFKEMTSFTGWTTLSALTFIMKTQGMNMILNIFFGPILNAAQGIAMQVNSAIKTFSQNFQTSFMPQIVKTYANHEYSNMMRLTFSGAKLSTYLLMAIAIPVILEAEYLLKLWLKEVPPYAVVLVALILIETIIQTMTCTGNTAIRATGKIKYYELVYNTIELLAFPLIYFLLIKYNLYYIPAIVSICFIGVASFAKLKFMTNLLPGFHTIFYFKDVILRCVSIAISASIFPAYILFTFPSGFLRLLSITCVFEFLFISLILWKGLNQDERIILSKVVNKFMAKIKR